MAEYLISYEAEGKTVTCPHCGNIHFSEGTAMLNTPGLTFIGLDWANRSATVLICKQCSRIEWFLKKPKVIRRSPLSGAVHP